MAEQCVLYQGEEHTLLGDVIAGRTTFRQSLEGIVGELKQTPAKALECDGESLVRFEELLGLVDALSEEKLDAADLNNTAEIMYLFRYLKKGVFKNAVLSVATGVFFYLPVIGLVSLLAGPWFWAKSIQYGLVACSAADAVKNPEKVLAPLYEAADSLDAIAIDSSFVFDIFNSARPRFEVVYAALPSKEREAVDKQLYRFLGAGGMPGMDELQLKDYLGGILEKAPKQVEDKPQQVIKSNDETPVEPLNLPVNPYSPFWSRPMM